MQRTEFLSQLAELLECDSPLTGEEELAGLEAWDSLAVLGFMALVDETYSKVLTPSDLSRCKTIHDLVRVASASEEV